MGPKYFAVLLLWMSCAFTPSSETKTQDSVLPRNERFKRLLPYMTFYLDGKILPPYNPYSYTPVPNVPNKLETQLFQNYLQGSQYQILREPILPDVSHLYRRLPYLVASQQIQEYPQNYEPVVYKAPKPKEPENLKPLRLLQNTYSLPLDQYQLFKQSPKVFSVTHFKTLSRPQYTESSEAPRKAQDVKQVYLQLQRPEIKLIKYRPLSAPAKDVTLSDYAEPDVQKPDVDKLTAEYYSQPKLVEKLPTYQTQKLVDRPLTYEVPKTEKLAAYRGQEAGEVQRLAQVLQKLQQANSLIQPRLPVSMKQVYSYLEKNPNDNSLQSLEDEKEDPDDKGSLDEENGGTPGKPGVDYPALSIVPHTKFNCGTQRYKGFFGDPETNCQVWHYCDLNGGQASFLCPNGTLFSQQALTCDWWFNVRCDATAQLYVLNERLYKYILPMKLSYPEDYSGPEVDNYIHLKFQEAEKKRKDKAKNQTATHMHENVPKEKEKEPKVVDVNKQVTLEDFLTKKSLQVKRGVAEGSINR